MPFNHEEWEMHAPLVHIGFPKALSSWLQKLFFKPEYGFINILDSLHTQISVIDPTPFSFKEEKSLEFIHISLKNQKSHKNFVPVCSAEALIGNPYCGGYNAKQNADRIKQLFPNARILFIVREQKSLMRSLYKTMIVWGMPHSLHRLLHPVDQSIAPQFNLDYFRFDLATAYYQNLFGRENVLVMPYESFKENPEKFTKTIQRFSGTTKQQDAAPPWGKIVNRNQNIADILWQRLLNALFLSSPFNYSGILSSTEKRIKKRIKRSKKNVFPQCISNFIERQFSEKISTEFAGKFSESNKRLEELTGLDLETYGYQLPQEQ